MREPKKERGRSGFQLRGDPEWKESEKRTAARGRRTRASGACHFDQMDADWSQWGLRVENKHTAAKSFRITDKLLEKTWRQARNMAAFPVLLIELSVAPESPTVPDRWVVLPEDVLLRLIHDGKA